MPSGILITNFLVATDEGYYFLSPTVEMSFSSNVRLIINYVHTSEIVLLHHAVSV
jgi:hypothetical protein